MSCLMTKPKNDLCAQQRLRSAWASAQSDQSSLSAWRNIGSSATNIAHCEDWSDWADAQVDLSLRGAHTSICWFCHEAAQIFSWNIDLSDYRCWSELSSLMVVTIGLIWKMSTLKPVHLALRNLSHFVASTELRNAENLNLISWIVLELQPFKNI